MVTRRKMAQLSSFRTSLHHVLSKRCHSAQHLRLEHAFILLLVFFLMVSCSSGQPAIVTKPTPTPQSTTIGGGGIPSPAATLLAPAPQSCPAAPSPGSKVFPQAVGGFAAGTTLFGHTPVWTDFFPTPPELYFDKPGAGTKILWEVDPNYTRPITVHVADLRTGRAAWWNLWGDGGTPTPKDATTTLVLNPNSESNQFYRGQYADGWHEWGTNISFFAAGCYAMEVKWSTGNWHIIFAVGRSH